MDVNEARKQSTKGAISAIEAGIERACEQGFSEYEIPDHICFNDDIEDHLTEKGFKVMMRAIKW